MLLQIDHHSGQPIYRQVIDQIRRQVVAGQLREGEQLPSVRDLAGQLRVNPMTISKAYSLLEMEGLLERRRGVGLFVRRIRKDQKSQTKTQLLEQALTKAVTTAIQLNIPQEQVHEVTERLINKEQRGLKRKGIAMTEQLSIPAGTFLDKENQARRCPCVLLLDTSGSMSQDPRGSSRRPIDLLNSALPEFRQAIADDGTARDSIEMAVITFGGTPNVIQDWTDVEHWAVSTLTADGNTPLGPAMQMAADMIESRRALYRQNDISSYVPWMFILTDGAPDQGPELVAAISRVEQMQQVTAGSKSPKLIAYACSTDTREEAMSRLRAVTPRTYKLEGMAYREVFLWLTASLKTVTRTSPGTPIMLPETPKQMTLTEARTITT
jgi:uncharacterized protein YegL/DNA-binding transcriptional regulator YhcF (GntR family)